VPVAMNCCFCPRGIEAAAGDCNRDQTWRDARATQRDGLWAVAGIVSDF